MPDPSVAKSTLPYGIQTGPGSKSAALLLGLPPTVPFEPEKFGSWAQVPRFIGRRALVGLARSFPCLFFVSFYAYTHMLESSSLLLALVHTYHNC